jgi:HlyD family secretion protein
MKKRIVIISIIIIAVLAGAFYLLKPETVAAEDIKIETTLAERGSVSNVVTATGTIEALLTVEVGTQVSGIIEEIYVDFNTYVKKGQLLAKLDTTNLAAVLEQSQASVDNAKAELDYQEANLERMKPLFEKNLISQADFDQVLYSFNKAKASYRSQLASHKRNQINLDYALIYSPIDGIVLNRAVEEGQTVAASFNTPTLFTIANDLTQMQVEANIDEADIGMVKEGQRVEFTVDAFPEEIFDGEVTEVRLEPVVSSNVVTYTIVISAYNPEYKLMPGMTAQTEIYVIEKNDIIIVPSKAARFTPDPLIMMSYMDNLGIERPERGDRDSEDRPEGSRPMGMKEGEDAPTMVWVMKDDMIRPQIVTLGMDDDKNVEIIDGLKEGDKIVLSMKDVSASTTASSSGVSNPFMPKPPRGGRP